MNHKDIKYENKITKEWDVVSAEYRYKLTPKAPHNLNYHYGDLDWAVRNAEHFGLEVEGYSKDPQDEVNEWVAEQNIKDGYTPAALEIIQLLNEIKEKL